MASSQFPDLKEYIVIPYTFIDDFRCFKPLDDVLVAPGEVAPSKEECSRLRSMLETMFAGAGWEGDGEINCIFVPPCFLKGREDGYCEPVFHVKQTNNGISFLAIPKSLELTFPKDMWDDKSVMETPMEQGYESGVSRISSEAPKKDWQMYISRYDKHIPQTDDLSLIVLKGHLLVEEMLTGLAELVLPNSRFLAEARLSFHQLTCVVKSAVRLRAEDKCWELILSLNQIRNELSHSLEPPKLNARLAHLWRTYDSTQPIDDIIIDKRPEAALDSTQRLRHVIIDCMQFLGSMIFRHGGLAH